MKYRVAQIVAGITAALAGAAIAASARPIDILLAISSSPQTDDAVVDVLRREAESAGLRCQTPEFPKPFGQHVLHLMCADGLRGSSLTAHNPISSPTIVVQGYRSKSNPEQLEAILRKFATSVQDIPNVKIVEARWKREGE
jgi:hypothetical protein